VLDIVKNGYEVPFKSFPPEAEFPNNATVRDNLEAAQQLVKDYLAQKVLRIVEQKPRCVNPLGLVSKKVNGQIKYRLIFDGSR